MHFSYFVFLNSVNFNREQKSGLNSAFFFKGKPSNASYMKIQDESSYMLLRKQCALQVVACRARGVRVSWDEQYPIPVQLPPPDANTVVFRLNPNAPGSGPSPLVPFSPFFMHSSQSCALLFFQTLLFRFIPYLLKRPKFHPLCEMI